MSATATKTRVLSEIATVQPGYLSRSRVHSVPGGPYRLLQASDVSEDRGVVLDQATRFRPERNPDLYRVKRGDILVVARGSNHRAHYVDHELENALAAATFYIVRPDADRVLPGYLAWWLNLPRVQADIDASSRGTRIAYIGREALETLHVPIPPLPVQRTIERVVALWRRKKSLQSQIDEKREHYIRAVCRQAVRPSKEH